MHPITALQTEYSLWARDVEDAILPACRHLGIGFVPYAPLGRGLLTGNVRYQVDRSLGVGGGASARRSGGDAASAYVFADNQSALGATRMQVDFAGAQGAQRTAQLSVDQAWPTQPGLRVGTAPANARRAPFPAAGI